MKNQVSFFSSMRGKMLVMCLILLFILMSGIGFSYRQARRSLEERIMNELKRIAQIQAKRIDLMLESYIRDIQLIAEMDDVRSTDRDRVYTYLRRVIRQRPNYISIKVFKADGSVVAEDIRPVEYTIKNSVSFSDRDYFRQVMICHCPVISDVIFSKEGTEGFIIVMAAPVFENGEVVRITGTAVTTKIMGAWLAESQIGNTGDVYMVDRRSYFITPSRFTPELKAENVIRKQTELELRIDTFGSRELQAGRTGVSIYYDYRGRKVVGAYAPVTAKGWGILVEQETDEAFVPVIRLRNMLVVMGIILTGLSAVFVFMTARSVTVRVDRLTETALELHKGNLSARVNIIGRDELGQLGKTFDVMAEKISILVRDLDMEIAYNALINQQLKESEMVFRTLFEATRDAVMLLDDEGFFDCNYEVLKIFGCQNKEDIVGKHPDEFSPKYQPSGELSSELSILRIETALRDGICFFEWQHRRMSGTEFPAEVLLSAMEVQGRKILQAVVRDITDRRKAEDTLRESEERFRTMIEQSPIAMHVFSSDGIICDTNQAAVELFGISADVLIGKYNIFKDRRMIQAGVIPHIEKTLAGRTLYNFENILETETGGKHWLKTSFYPLKDKNGCVRNFVTMHEDITELKLYHEHLEDLVKERTAELTAALTETHVAREAADAVNKKITDSLNYAKLIQSSLLANMDVVKTYMPNSFFIWEPRDIVGGDIFFAEKLEDGFIVAVIDCTGHGVPGAFMTMIAISALRRIIRDDGCHDPAEILKRLNFIVKTTLHQDKAYALSDDGLDAGICFVREQTADGRSQKIPVEACAFQTATCSLTFAGAKLSLFYVHNHEVNVIAGDKQSIGYRRSDLNFNFSDRTICIEKGTVFYMASDGFTDQLDGRDRRFGSRRFRELLKKIAHLPFKKQREILLAAFEVHKGNNQRQDDVTVACFGF